MFGNKRIAGSEMEHKDDSKKDFPPRFAKKHGGSKGHKHSKRAVRK
jgi:hypothetical protein